MEEEYNQSASLGVVQKIRDLEDRQKISSDRLLLTTKTVLDERSRAFKEMQVLKSEIIILKKELQKSKDMISYLAEQISKAARKDEISIIQRQLDLIRK